MKEICPPKAKPSSKPECGKSPLEQPTNNVKDKETDMFSKVDEIALPAIAEDSPISNSPITPLNSKITLEGKKRRRGKPGTKNSSETESNSAITDDKTVSASSKRKRRTSWTSLKEIAERRENDDGQNITNLPIPFSL